MHMQTANIHEAKTHLSRLIEAVAAGDEVVIGKANLPRREGRAAAAAGDRAGHKNLLR